MTDPTNPSTPHKKPRHSLSSIDEEKLSAICSICGPTGIYKAKSGVHKTAYMCATRSHQRSAAYRQLHPHTPPSGRQFNPMAHTLSNVDDQNRTAICLQCGPVKIYVSRSKNYVARVCRNASSQRVENATRKRRTENGEFVERYKLERGCQNCSDREDSKTLQLHAPGGDRRADHIGKLMGLKAERLVQELQKYEVLCENCHDKVHFRRPSKPRRKHKPLPFRSHTK